MVGTARGPASRAAQALGAIVTLTDHEIIGRKRCTENARIEGNHLRSYAIRELLFDPIASVAERRRKMLPSLSAEGGAHRPPAV
jgi:hypothetical protein